MSNSQAASAATTKDSSTTNTSRSKGTGVFINSLYLQEQNTRAGTWETDDNPSARLSLEECSRSADNGRGIAGPVGVPSRDGGGISRSAPAPAATPQTPPPPPPPPPPRPYQCSGSTRSSLEVLHPFAAAAAAGPMPPSARSSLDSLSFTSLQGQLRSSMDVSSRRCSTDVGSSRSMSLIIPDWDPSAAGFDVAPFDMSASYSNSFASAAADDLWNRDHSFTAPVAAQQQLMLGSSFQETATFAGCQMQQQHSAIAPLRALAPVCTAAADSQPLQLLLRQLQQQGMVMSSPISSADHISYDDCMAAFSSQPMHGIGGAAASSAQTGRRTRRSSFCVERGLPPAAATRQRPASFSSGTRCAQQQQQQLMMMMAGNQQLVGDPAGSTSFSDPLPMLLPQQHEQQQQQEEQMWLCQDMSFTGQLSTAVYEPTLDDFVAQGGMLLEDPVMPAAPQQQPEQQLQAHQQQLMMMLGRTDVESMPLSPQPRLVLPEMPGQQQQQQQQQQQLCMTIGAATTPTASPPFNQAAVNEELAAAHDKLQRLLLDSKILSQLQQNIQQELLQLLPMP